MPSLPSRASYSVLQSYVSDLIISCGLVFVNLLDRVLTPGGGLGWLFVASDSWLSL